MLSQPLLMFNDARKSNCKCDLCFEFLQHTRNLIRIAAQRKRPPHRILVSEIFPSHRFRQDNGIGFLECGLRISLAQGKIEDLEDVCIHKQDASFVEMTLLICNKRLFIFQVKPDRVFY